MGTGRASRSSDARNEDDSIHGGKCMKKNTTKQYLFAACSADDGLPIAIEPTVRALSERFEVPENTFRSCMEKRSVSKKANVFIFRIPNPFYEAKAVV